MSAADPFTRASPHYRAAMALPHKSGPGLEIWRPRRTWVSWLRLIAGGAVFWLVLLIGSWLAWVTL